MNTQARDMLTKATAHNFREAAAILATIPVTFIPRDPSKFYARPV